MTNKETINSFLYTLFGFKKARNTTHILFIILIHCTGWCLLFFLPVLLYPVRVNDGNFITRELIDKSVLVAIFYFNYYFLIPRFFEKKKYFIYSLVILLLFLVYLTQHVIVRSSYFPRRAGPFTLVHSGQVKNSGRGGKFIGYSDGAMSGSVFISNDTVNGLTAITRFPVPGDTATAAFPSFPLPETGWLGIPKGFWAVTLNNVISSFALLLLMGGFIRLAYSFVRNQNEKKVLENANLNAEVNFLKSQINPHFLFNTLNGIYSQAHNRSEHTEHSILKLSNLLRYVLYESAEEKVELSKDIQYLTNYIDLQKLRLSQKVKVDYEVEGNLHPNQIAPLLLITFVENAFKHGISYSNPSTIGVHISIFEQTLTMVVSNPVLEKNRFAGGGLGLKNVTRRLDLLYPGKYLLDIVHNDCLHIVNLKIDLTND